MSAPQITVIALWALSLGLTLAKHGQPQDTKHNAWTSLISIALFGGILWWGGFWQ